MGWMFTVVVGVGAVLASSSAAQGPSVEQALRIKPRQPNIDFDNPAKEEIEGCRIEKSKKSFGQPGYVVYDASGRILRLFLDVNRDGSLDQWSYFKAGIEVYRDLDTNHDKRTDQYRWLGSAGTRWGVDEDQEGEVDTWKRISAEEVAEEVFRAVQEGDVDRFRRLLAKSDELKSLQTGPEINELLTRKIREASVKFASVAKDQTAISKDSRYVHFGSNRPGLVPAGYRGLKRDVLVYDHAAAVFETGETFGQISLGTLVQIGDTWRVLELPQIIDESSIVANGGVFYSGDQPPQTAATTATGEGDDAMSRLFSQFDEIEKALEATDSAKEIEKLEKQRAEILLALVQKSDGDDRVNWFRQMTDTITGAYQNERLNDGLELLDQYVDSLKDDKIEIEEDYARWRALNARFSRAIQSGTRKERDRANERYIGEMESFVKEYAKSPYAADALLQLALYSEVTDGDNTEGAIRWYRELLRRFPNTANGKRARGALVRLEGEGKRIPFSGKDLDGHPFDLKKMKGKIVVIHFWETWCESCIDEFDELKRLASKYRSELVVVGANLDTDQAKVTRFLKDNPKYDWIQLHAPGSVEESPLAIQLGVTTLPMTLLIDADGKLVSSTFLADDLDREIQRLIRNDEKSADRGARKRRR